MPRLNHIAQVPLGSNGDYSVADAADLALNDPGDEDQEETSLQRNQTLVIVQDAGGAGGTVTLETVPDPFGRDGPAGPGQFSYSLGSNELAMFGPFEDTGWRQSNGKLNFQVSSAQLKVAVIRLP